MPNSQTPTLSAFADTARLIYTSEICRNYGITQRGLRKWIATGKFPRPDVNLHGRNAWYARTAEAHRVAVDEGFYRRDKRLQFRREPSHGAEKTKAA